MAKADPIFYAEKELVAPVHEVPSEFGTTNYGGLLAVSEGFLVVYEAWDPEVDSLRGRVRVLDRLSLRELEVISLADFQDESGRGFSMALDGDHLLIAHAGIFSEGKNPQLAGYDLGEGARKLFLKELDFEIGYGLQAVRYEDDWLVWNSEGSQLIDGTNGEELRRWPVAFGEFVGEHFFFRAEPNEYWLVDLRVGDAVRDLTGLPGVVPGVQPAFLEVAGGLIVIHSRYWIEEEDSNETISDIYDPVTDGLIWKVEESSYLDRPKRVGDFFFLRRPLGGGVMTVYEAATGAVRTTLSLPEGLETYEFGDRVALHEGVFYVSGGAKSYLYDAQSFASLGEIEPGELFSRALVMAIPGSWKLAWIANDGRSPIPQINSYLWNPQVLIYDPETRIFEGRIEPEDVISRSTSGLGGFPSPENFGMEFFTMPNGKVAMKSSRMSGGGAKYQVFDPILRVEPPRAELTASVRYEEAEGVASRLERRSQDGGIEVLQESSFGQGEGETVDVPPLSGQLGERYFLNEVERVAVVSDYVDLVNPLPFPEGLRTGKKFLMAPDAGAIVMWTTESARFDVLGTLTVLNSSDGSERFAIGPRGRGFGSFWATDGSFLAVATSQTYAADSILVFDLGTGLEKISLPVASAFAVSGDVIVRFHDEELIGHRISSDEELYRVQIPFELPYRSFRPRLWAGGGVAIFEKAAYDLETGDFRFDLVSPNPEEGDYFGTQIVADGGVIAAVSTPQATGYLYDVVTGEFLRSFMIEELGEGFRNYASSQPRLAIDAEAGVIAWGVNDAVPVPVVNLFEIATGKRFAQVRAPRGDPRVYEGVGDGVALSPGRVWLKVSVGEREGVATYNYASVRGRELETRESELFPDQFLKLSWRGHRGVQYQASGGRLDDLRPTGPLISGRGVLQHVLLPVPAGEQRWFGALEPSWEPPPSPFPLVGDE